MSLKTIEADSYRFRLFFFLNAEFKKTLEIFDVILLGIDLIAESLTQKRKYVRLIMDKTNISLYNC